MRTADDIIKALGMREHIEGGYFAFIWKSAQKIAEENLPPYFNGSRKAASVIYYLLKQGQVSCWHKLLADEFWFWHEGGTLEMTLGGLGATPVGAGTYRLGCHLAQGEHFQAHIPAAHWQTTKVVKGDYALVSCMVAPGFEEQDCYFEDSFTR